MHLKINLASRSYLNRPQFNAGAALLGLVLGCLLLVNIRNVATNAGESSIAAKQVALYEGKGSGVVPEKEYNAVLAKIKFANEVIAKKRYDWIALLDRLEVTVPEGIALTAIEPNQKTEELKLTGAAKTFNNLRQFLENLESSGHFRDVFLVSQADFAIGETQKGITFNVSCKAGLK